MPDRPIRESARKALAKLYNIEPYDTDSDDDCANPEDLADVVNDDQSFEDETASSTAFDESSNEEPSEDENESATSSDGSSKEDQEDNCYSSKDGTSWTLVQQCQNVGRTPKENLFTPRPGVKHFAKRLIDSEVAAWELLMTKRMVQNILKYTNEKIISVEGDAAELITLDQLKAFLGLTYLRGGLGWRRMSVHELWSSEFGSEYFKSVMSRPKFERIMKFIRFDNMRMRRVKVSGDLFFPFRELLDDFNCNCEQVFQPYPGLTVDEQLLPMKNRCKFIQYMPQKPDKFGIKFWLLVDVETKFCLKYFPYLGRQDLEQRGNDNLGSYVCKQLLENYLNCGYNVCADNFFTSAPLADWLLSKRTTLVGTLRHSSKSTINHMKVERPLYSSTFYQSGGKLAVSYQAKPKKIVLLLSTMHKNPVVVAEEKKKPDIIHFYNQHKVGVDCLDSMLRLYSCKAASRRWPMGCFFDLLDKAALNAWIIYNDAVPDASITRKEFILRIGKQLCSSVQQQKPKQPPNKKAKQMQEEASRTTCSVHKCRNKTSSSCFVCAKPCCGIHSQKHYKCTNCCE